MIQCPACGEPFGPPPPPKSKDRATAVCPHCGRVVVLGASPSPAAGANDPSTEAFLEPLQPGESPTQIGVASQTLSLPPGKRVSVAILSGPRKGDVVVLSGPRLTFGRDGGGADIQVPDLDVSRSHAALECHGPRIVLRDLGSRNGTLVAGQRVSQRDIESQEEFQLGGTTFLLLVADE
jgi:Inner membrane component of T3SS, cytoplasmic domain